MQCIKGEAACSARPSTDRWDSSLSGAEKVLRGIPPSHPHLPPPASRAWSSPLDQESSAPKLSLLQSSSTGELATSQSTPLLPPAGEQGSLW